LYAAGLKLCQINLNIDSGNSIPLLPAAFAAFSAPDTDPRATKNPGSFESGCFAFVDLRQVNSRMPTHDLAIVATKACAFDETALTIFSRDLAVATF
jgi:hypothetical protein